MSVSVSLQHDLGDFRLDVAFESQGRLTALFGASGSGKTTAVNMIAGLIRPRTGRIVVGDTVLTDTAQSVAVPLHRRRIGYVFQDARLFPHLSVRDNLGYGRWFAPRQQRYADESAIVDLLGIGHLLDRRPAHLSGGERQRVAIGRALLSSPRLLLMDEPLAALDQDRKEEILPYIERLRDETGIPIIYVSHSIAEVSRLATDIVILADGRVAASGPAADMALRLDLMPRDEAGEGGSILDMTVESHDTGFGMTVLRADAGSLHVPGAIAAPGTPVRIRVRARDVMLATSEPKNISALNILNGQVAAMAPAGPSSVNVAVDCAGAIVMATITRQSAVALAITVGTPVFAIVKAVSVKRP